MNKLFDLNAPFMVFLSWLADMIILSLLWFVCSIPIITCGPATAALYNVTLKMARKEDCKLVSTFFKAFKDNLKQGIVLTILFLVLGVVILLDFWIMSGAEGTAAGVYTVCFAGLGILLLCTVFYTFPMQAQFVNPIKQTLKNAFLLSMQKLLDTVIVFVLNMLPVFFALASLWLFVLSIPVWVLLAPGVIAFVCSKRFVKMFDPMIRPTETQDA